MRIEATINFSSILLRVVISSTLRLVRAEQYATLVDCNRPHKQLFKS